MDFFRRKNLHNIADLKLIGQRHNTSVPLSSIHSVSYSAVYGIGKVDRYRMGRQRYNISFGCKDKYFVCHQTVFERIEKFACILGFTLPVKKLTKPGKLAVNSILRIM